MFESFFLESKDSIEIERSLFRELLKLKVHKYKQEKLKCWEIQGYILFCFFEYLPNKMERCGFLYCFCICR